jgi:diphthamide biosynthesis methyltransferase
MLYLIGLGLSDETDITVKGLEIVRKASRVYLEAYTSILLVDKAILVCPSTPHENSELTLMCSRSSIMAGK